MNRQDHDRLQRCKRALIEQLKKKKGYKAIDLKETIAMIDDKLCEPIVEIENTGEHLKVENPFV